MTQAGAPSVIQVRTQDATPDHLEKAVIGVLKQCEALLEEGTLIILDEAKLRVRILPLTSRKPPHAPDTE